jgi:hypothetical protein
MIKKLVTLFSIAALSATMAMAQSPQPLPAPKKPTPAAVFDQAIVDTAMGEMGVYKMPGTQDERVRQYVEETGNPIEFYTDDGWCSSFVAWDLKRNGYQYASFPTGEEWAHVADTTDDPQIGDIVLIPGHIAFFGGWLDLPGYGRAVLLLGGNQAHRVCYLPIGTANVMYFLVPRKATADWKPRHHFNEELAASGNLLNDKTNIMSILEYQMNKNQRTNPAPNF